MLFVQHELFGTAMRQLGANNLQFTFAVKQNVNGANFVSFQFFKCDSILANLRMIAGLFHTGKKRVFSGRQRLPFKRRKKNSDQNSSNIQTGEKGSFARNRGNKRDRNNDDSRNAFKKKIHQADRKSFRGKTNPADRKAFRGKANPADRKTFRGKNNDAPRKPFKGKNASKRIRK